MKGAVLEVGDRVEVTGGEFAGDVGTVVDLGVHPGDVKLEIQTQYELIHVWKNVAILERLKGGGE